MVLLEPEVKLRSQVAALLEGRGFQVAAIDTERAAMDHLRGPDLPGCIVVDRTALSGPGPALAADLSRRCLGQTWMVFIESTRDPAGGRRLCEPAEQLVSAVHLACSHHEIATHAAQPSR